jgi:hypothetical protein
MVADCGLPAPKRVEEAEDTGTLRRSGELEGSDEALKRPESSVTPPRDQYGRFLPTKRPLEFTWPHFWLEVSEVALAILIANAAWELIVWLVRS